MTDPITATEAAGLYRTNKISLDEMLDRMDATPNEELRGLIDNWRDEYPNDEPLGEWESGNDVARRECAGELEDVLR